MGEKKKRKERKRRWESKFLKDFKVSPAAREHAGFRNAAMSGKAGTEAAAVGLLTRPRLPARFASGSQRTFHSTTRRFPGLFGWAARLEVRSTCSASRCKNDNCCLEKENEIKGENCPLCAGDDLQPWSCPVPRPSQPTHVAAGLGSAWNQLPSQRARSQGRGKPGFPLAADAPSYLFFPSFSSYSYI